MRNKCRRSCNTNVKGINLLLAPFLCPARASMRRMANQASKLKQNTTMIQNRRRNRQLHRIQCNKRNRAIKTIKIFNPRTICKVKLNLRIIIKLRMMKIRMMKIKIRILIRLAMVNNRVDFILFQYFHTFNIFLLETQSADAMFIISKFIPKVSRTKMLDKAERLKIAFVTDIHLHTRGIEKLSQWANTHYNTQSKFDYCFIGGDTANCNHDKLDHDEEEMFQKTIDAHKSIKDIFNCKVFFVPGNHDCKFFFNSANKIQGFYNLHHKKIQLSEGLDLIGFGGSVPGYVDGKHYWAGYPFSSDKELATEWEKNDLLGQKQSPKGQFIMLTHIGPNASETTLDRSQYPQISVVSGSNFFNKYLERKNLLAWFHGHTHEGSRSCRIFGRPIINPGPLAHNKFMHFQLIKQQSKWKLSKTAFEDL